MTAGQHALTEPTARRLLTASSMIQYRMGLTDYLGHTSVRLAAGNGYLIKPKHSPSVRAMDALGPGDFLVVDEDGLAHDGGQPPSEVFIHTEILKRRPDVNVVVHTHQPKATLMGVLGAPVLPLLHIVAPLLEHEIPTWDCSLLVQDASLGASLADTLGEAAVAHLRGHGVVCVGATIEEATVHAIFLELAAAANLDALQTGIAPRVVPPEEIARLPEQMAPVAGRWAYYASITDVDDALLR